MDTDKVILKICLTKMKSDIKIVLTFNDFKIQMNKMMCYTCTAHLRQKFAIIKHCSIGYRSTNLQNRVRSV